LAELTASQFFWTAVARRRFIRTLLFDAVTIAASGTLIATTALLATLEVFAIRLKILVAKCVTRVSFILGQAIVSAPAVDGWRGRTVSVPAGSDSTAIAIGAAIAKSATRVSAGRDGTSNGPTAAAGGSGTSLRAGVAISIGAGSAPSSRNDAATTNIGRGVISPGAASWAFDLFTLSLDAGVARSAMIRGSASLSAKDCVELAGIQEVKRGLILNLCVVYSVPVFKERHAKP